MDAQIQELHGYTIVKVFSATMQRERLGLGDRVTEWLASTGIHPIHAVVRQSSDREYHCLTVCVFGVKGDPK